MLLHFVHRGRQVQLRASAKGWAQMFLKANPWSDKRRSTRHDYEQNALKQGDVAVNGVLRDWIKGQVTAINSGILSFEAVFMPFMLTSDGRSLIERLAETNLLPAPTPSKVVSIMKGNRTDARFVFIYEGLVNPSAINQRQPGQGDRPWSMNSAVGFEERAEPPEHPLIRRPVKRSETESHS